MKNVELFNDHFQNYKVYNIPKAQLIIADIPYNIGKDAYASNPAWYEGGIIRMAKVGLRLQSFSIQTKIFAFQNSCISVARC